MFKKAIRQFVYGYMMAEARKFKPWSEPWKACRMVCNILSGEYKDHIKE